MAAAGPLSGHRCAMPCRAMGRHVHGIDEELRLEIVPHRPTHDPPRESIPHDGQVDKARPGRNVRHVARHCPRTNCGQGSPQSWFGPAAQTFRSTRSLAGRTRSSRGVVRVPLRRLTSAKAAAFTSRSIRLRPTAMPSSTARQGIAKQCPEREPALRGSSVRHRSAWTRRESWRSARSGDCLRPRSDGARRHHA